MIKIYPKIVAAIGATKDRKYINQFAKGKVQDSKLLYDSLVKKSGPPASTFQEKINCWFKAYNANLEKIKWIEDIKNQFKEK